MKSLGSSSQWLRYRIVRGEKPIPRLDESERLETLTSFRYSELQVILGSLLSGCGFFKEHPEKVGSYFFCLRHKPVHFDYMAYKAHIIRRFDPKLWRRVFFESSLSRLACENLVFTANHLLFGDLHSLFFAEDGSLVLPHDYVVANLNVFGLAIWFQDCGIYNGKKVIFCTHRFQKSQVEKAAYALGSKFGLMCYIDVQGNIVVDPHSCSAFFQLIKPLVHEVFKYKVGDLIPPSVTVCKRLTFDAAHYLLDYHGKCNSLHGHTYFCDIEVKRPVDPESGFVVDFSTLKKKTEYMIKRLDHKVINRCSPMLGINATAEHIAILLASMWEKIVPGLKKVRVYETPTSWAEIDVETEAGLLHSYLDYVSQISSWWSEVQEEAVRDFNTVPLE